MYLSRIAIQQKHFHSSMLITIFDEGPIAASCATFAVKMATNIDE